MSINLSKGQKILLDKEAGRPLTKVIMGLGWDAVKSQKKSGFFSRFLADGADIDLDASCVVFNGAKQAIDTVWFQQLRSQDDSIVHTGDNLTGAGSGDDEQIIVDLSRVSSQVTTLVFVVNSFRGQTFERVQNAFCRLVDQLTEQEIAKFNLSCQGNHTGQIMAKLCREAGGWQFHAIGKNTHGRTFQDLLPAIQAEL
ncbi:MAG: Tellurium resistance protein terZ [Beggiatoa sp. IS2]|nr:MAG: Tellurium resistance protein terZ [Beggiatoa sp. IS2]